MKIAFIIPGKYGFHGARYKYFNLFNSIEQFECKLWKEPFFQEATKWRPRIFAIWGDIYPTYRLINRERRDYILLEHDVSSLRTEFTEQKFNAEKSKICSASKIIFTSPVHRDYIIKKYARNPERCIVIQLRPSIKDLEFEPLPKLRGKHLVYAGGLLDEKQKDGKYGYRSYKDIFKQFIRAGWKVHLYPIRRDPEEYKEIGCIYHEPVPEGKELYRELSQYTASLQAFNKTGVNEKSYKYCQTCYPNKLWLGLAAGIPTIGINGGEGMKVYEDKWGIVMNFGDKISQIPNRIKALNIAQHRAEQNIEAYQEELINFMRKD